MSAESLLHLPDPAADKVYIKCGFCYCLHSELKLKAEDDPHQSESRHRRCWLHLCNMHGRTTRNSEDHDHEIESTGLETVSVLQPRPRRELPTTSLAWKRIDISLDDVQQPSCKQIMMKNFSIGCDGMIDFSGSLPHDQE